MGETVDLFADLGALEFEGVGFIDGVADSFGENDRE